MQTNTQKAINNDLTQVATDFSFIQAEAMPIEMVTCIDGQTFVLVSIEYMYLTRSTQKLSLKNSVGLRSCLLGKATKIIVAKTIETKTNFINHLKLFGL